MDITTLINAQRSFFSSGATLDLSYRRRALDKLEHALDTQESELFAALKSDLNKSFAESFLCELSLIRMELRYAKTHITRWAKSRRVPSPLTQFPASSRLLSEPYGIVLIMSPWNYPFLLALEPLIGAIAAGNCCVVKPSPDAPASSAALQKLLSSCFSPEYIAVVDGGLEQSQALLEQSFDYIFFTGGTQVGRVVMEKAAQHLTPVTLELGGKSPCVVDATAPLDLTAKRIIFGKLLNSGQTCVAPDYLLVHAKIKEKLIQRLQHWISAFYGQDPLDNQGYVHIINQRHFDRIIGLINPNQVVFGGKYCSKTRAIQPTLLDGVSWQDPVMQEEIFGPLLPILTFTHLEEAADLIRARPKPLALYFFSRDRTAQRWFMKSVPFGGGCINDTILHLTSPHLPFGGVGESGMGAYHGKASFDTFSHTKSILVGRPWLDLPLRYPPYTDKNLKRLRRFLK
ncbi:MAG: aldehyde dehydrogenase [Lawsonibacter sp.]